MFRRDSVKDHSQDEVLSGDPCGELYDSAPGNGSGLRHIAIAQITRFGKPLNSLTYTMCQPAGVDAYIEMCQAVLDRNLRLTSPV